ncbi:hypothetical protein C8R45DRAFT_1068858 [Mycena sanguinolenta]|nr:hypothetical protein C8R45DRAFT_1068858 [Mycena sanguinolenta]
MNSQNPDSEWCHIESRFEGPGSTQSGDQFVLSVILQPGAEKLCSGIHVVVCYREDDPELRKLAVKDDVGRAGLVKLQRERAQERAPTDLEQVLAQALSRAGQTSVDRNEPLLAEQEAAHRASDALLEHGLPALDLPLCTVAYEIQDSSNDTWRSAKLVLLPSWPIVDGPLTHDPVVLYLNVNYTLRGSLKRNDTSGLMWAYPLPMGIIAATVHILPGARHPRRIFTQPPPEILSTIFGCAVEDKRESWRATLVSFALVCRDWVVALEHLFHDFGSTPSPGDRGIKMCAVSKCVQARPQLGNAIWSLSQGHFDFGSGDEQKYLELAIAFKDILYSAKHVRRLEIIETHSSLWEEFIEALGQSRDVTSFTINSVPFDGQKYWCLPTLPDLFRCFLHWERLHELKLSGWDGSNPFLQIVQQFTPTQQIDQTPPLSCALKTVLLFNGPITAPQLSNLTAGSHASLSNLDLNGVVGLSNSGLKDWLFEAGGSLQRLNIEKCSVAKAADEEYALDAAVGHLAALSNLRVDGDIVSELAISRKIAPTERDRRDEVYGLEDHCSTPCI